MPNIKKINNIFVVGLGLIGSSLTRSLKESNQFKSIIGYDTSREVISIATKEKYIDATVEN